MRSVLQPAALLATALLAAALALAACAPPGLTVPRPPEPARASQPAHAALPTSAPEDLGLSPAGLDRLTEALAAFVDSGMVGGVYGVIARGGRIGWEMTYGWRDVAASSLQSSPSWWSPARQSQLMRPSLSFRRSCGTS